MKNLSVALVLVIGLWSCSNNSKTTTETTDSTVNTETTTAQSDDNELVSELIESMYGGIALMKQGQTKATDQSVKELAKKLETEHTKLTEDLKSLAAKKGWTVATGESSSDMNAREDMADDQVADYQKEWLEALRDRHETNISKLENHSTTDADLRAASTKGLPKLKELLANIESVQGRMK